MPGVPSCRAHDGLLPGLRGCAVSRLQAIPAQSGRRGVMAAQPQLRFCGRCGAPLPPGATYCGRCGTPVATAAVAQPIYRYAPPPAYPTARQYKLAPAMIAGGLVLILIVAAVIAGAFAASQFAGGTHAPGTVDCSPKVVTPLSEEASFTSSAYKVQ